MDPFADFVTHPGAFGYASPKALALNDVDGDGLVDLVTGQGNGGAASLAFYKNQGTNQAPVWRKSPGCVSNFNCPVGTTSQNPLANVMSATISNSDGEPVFVQLYNDRWDLVIMGNSLTYATRGTGSPVAYTTQTGASNPFNSISSSNNLYVCFGDLDGDGDNE